MKILDPGHRYLLKNLKSPGVTELQFYKDPELHGGLGAAGTSVQEVLRAIIDRVRVLDSERPWFGNAAIVSKAREMLGLFEARALIRKAEKGVRLEELPTFSDGHLGLLSNEAALWVAQQGIGE